MGMEGSGLASGQAGWHRQSWAMLPRSKAFEEGQAYRIGCAACWPFSSKPESRGPGELGACLATPKALMGQARKWEEMGVRVGSEENIASG